MQSIDVLFKGRHFEREIIILCVRWYLRFKLSFRDLVEMMAERGIDLAHTTIMRWIQRYVPAWFKTGLFWVTQTIGILLPGEGGLDAEMKKTGRVSNRFRVQLKGVETL